MKTITIPILKAADILDQIEERIKDLEPVLIQIGKMMVGRSQKTFRDQRLGDIEWPRRYDTMSDPFINIAGALNYLNRDKPILNKNRLFQRKPALIDTGTLRRSISSRVVGNAVVEWGSTLPYAADHQFGKTTYQLVSQTARQRLFTEMKRTKRSKSEKITGRKDALKKLGFLFSVDAIETDLAPRPFVGITDQDQTDIRRHVENHIGGIKL